MSIRTEAAAAFEAEREARVDAALDHLTSTVLYDPAKSGPVVDPKTLTVAYEDYDADMFIFTDSDVFLAVRGEDVLLVEGSGEDWTKVDGPLTTLAGLGEALNEAA